MTEDSPSLNPPQLLPVSFSFSISHVFRDTGDGFVLEYPPLHRVGLAVMTTIIGLLCAGFVWLARDTEQPGAFAMVILIAIATTVGTPGAHYAIQAIRSGYSLRHSSRVIVAAAFCALCFHATRAAEEGGLPPVLLARARAATALVDAGADGMGSAFLVHSSGLFVTARHVIAALPEGATFKLVLHSGETGQKVVTAHVAMVFADEDLAFLRADEPIAGEEPLPLAGDGELTELKPVIECGYPFGTRLAGESDRYPAISLNTGHVSALRRERGQLSRIQLDAAANPGNSGGRILNGAGEAVGVLVSGLGKGVNFAVPMARVIDALTRPILSLRTSEIAFQHRAEPHDFAIEILPPGSAPPASEITLRLGEAGEARTFAARPDGQGFRVTAPPCDPASGSAPLRLRVQAAYHGMVITANAIDQPVRVAGRELQLSEIRAYETEKHHDAGKDEVRRTTKLVHYDRARGESVQLPAAPDGLPTLKGELLPATLNLAESDGFTISAYDPGAEKIPYEITLSSGGRVMVTHRGELTVAAMPASIGARSDDDDDVSAQGIHQMLGAFMPGEDDDAGLRLDRWLDPAKEMRQGRWQRKNGCLETAGEGNSWCELPIMAAGNYSLHLRLTPLQAQSGELLLLLPVGHQQALLHLDGSARGMARLDLIEARADDQQASTAIAPFELNREVEVRVKVVIDGEQALIAASINDRQFIWAGPAKYLVTPKDLPVTAGRIGLGERGLGMSLQSLRLQPEGGRLRFLRELPEEVECTREALYGRWPLDYRPKSDRIPSDLSRGLCATIIGEPEIGLDSGPLGGGSMRIKPGGPAGFRVAEHGQSNQALHFHRAHTMWFKLDPDPKLEGKRLFLLDEGGKDRGLVAYLLNGTLYAGGWDTRTKWNGTWFRVTDLQPDRWYHVALALTDEPKKKLLQLYLNGAEVGHGFGRSFGPHEFISIGINTGTTRLAPTDPLKDSAENRHFFGLIDDVLLFNGSLSTRDVQILAAGRFHSEPPKGKGK